MLPYTGEEEEEEERMGVITFERGWVGWGVGVGRGDRDKEWPTKGCAGMAWAGFRLVTTNVYATNSLHEAGSHSVSDRV